MPLGIGITGFSIFWLVALIFASLKIVKQYERGVLFTLGKFSGVMQPGLRIVIPVVQTWERIDIRVKTVDIPSQECVSKDNVSLKVNAAFFTLASLIASLADFILVLS